MDAIASLRMGRAAADDDAEALLGEAKELAESALVEQVGADSR